MISGRGKLRRNKCKTERCLDMLNKNKLFIVEPCFWIYFSSRNPKNATELTEEPLPVHSMSNINLNTNMCLYFMYITCNQRLTAKWLITWSFLLTHQLSMASCADRLDCRIRKLLDWSSDWLSACCQWRNDHCRMSRHESFNSYKQIQDRQRTLPPLLIFVSRNSWQQFAEPSLTVEVYCTLCFGWAPYGIKDGRKRLQHVGVHTNSNAVSSLCIRVACPLHWL